MEIWQEYIRQTHALRSGKRIRDYFWNLDSSVASALDKICVGHWLDIADISEAKSYYKDDSVNGETVNVKALTIYIRLIDLFDLAQDRTPYVLWKYVNPQNKYSKMEWKKHRALNPITCPDYDSGRVLRISGSTDDHEVYAALMDYKKLCERYFKESIDFLLNMSDPRCEFDVHLLDWRIEPRNFKPIDIGFSLDKQQIFNVLSDEIYNSHPYVYVRELIQNSLDAVALRKEILDRKKVGGDNIGHIYLEFNQDSNSDYILICRDDGIGMNEYVLKNYFSVLGKSYYESNDFKNKGLKMHSISKFGIGILSCFSVADQMEIITKREPYMEEGSKGLRVIINDIQRTFRVEELPDYKSTVGTEIKLHISAAQLYAQLKKNDIDISKYSITDYLQMLLQYIDYPVFVNEQGKHTVLLSPEYDKDKLQKVFPEYEDYKIVLLEERFPVEQIVNEYDIDTFNKYYKIVRVDLQDDLGIENIRGCMFFAVLKDNNTEVRNNTAGWPASVVDINVKERVRWIQSHFWDEDFWRAKRNNRIIDVYNKGILLEKGSEGIDRIVYNFRSNLYPSPYIMVNYPDTINSISVSRFSMISEKNILKKMLNKLGEYVANKYFSELPDDDNYLYWRSLTYLLTQFHLSPQNIPLEEFKDLYFPFIDEKGTLIYEKTTEKSEIRLLPISQGSVATHYNSTGEIKLESKWKYGKCLLTDRSSRFCESIQDYISNIIIELLEESHYMSKIDFYNDAESKEPVYQIIYSIGDHKNLVQRICEILSDFDVSIDEDWSELKKALRILTHSTKILSFTEEYSKLFAFGKRFYNVNNPKVQMLIKYHWFFEYYSKNLKVDQSIIDAKKDAFYQLPLITTSYKDAKVTWSFAELNKALSEVHSWIKTVFPELSGNEVVLSKEDFMANSIRIVSDDSFKYLEQM
ncbi:HD domain-containing protein [Ruminococcus difficilis]|uniref:ATP-binding protein n=1 Tax=Ruminococcus difficilis TaxID=2763069 RepID=A0A934TZD8_9FIRM|nr:ATP-binding protein [Ruminococcus difficilis]MBK6087643.1 ATP-binding protein [Ruminococcus difficilis]